MKLDKLFQNLLLIDAVVVLINTPARSEEVREDVEGELSTATVGKSTFNNTVAVTDKEFTHSKSSVLTFNNRKSRHQESQVASYLQRAKSDKSSKNIPQLSEIELGSPECKITCTVANILIKDYNSLLFSPKYHLY